MEGSVSLTPQVQGSPTYSSPELPPRQPVGQGRTIDADPTRLPSVRPVAPAGSTGVTDAGALQGFVQLFGGSRISGQVTKDSLAASGARVSNSLFDLIDRGMKIEGEEGASTGDGVLTEEEIQQFFSNVGQFAQMAQLPQTDAELARVALLYNKEGGKYTRVNIEDLQRIGTSIMQAWTGTIQEPYKKAAEFYPRATQPVLDGISRKINSGKAFADAGLEGQQKALMALQLADSFALDINALYQFGESLSQERSGTPSLAGTGAGGKISLTPEQQEKIGQYQKLLRDGKTEEAKQYWDSIKNGFPTEIADQINELQDLMSLAPKIKTVTEAMDRGDLAKASAEFEKIKPTLSESEIKKTEHMLVMANFENKLMSEGVDSAKAYFETVKRDLPPDMVANIEQVLKDPELPKKIQEAAQAKEKEKGILEDLQKVSIIILGELGVALGEKSPDKTKKATDAILAIFDKNKDNGAFWGSLNTWSRSEKVPEQARNQISGRFADHSSGIAFLDECRAFVGEK